MKEGLYLISGWNLILLLINIFLLWRVIYTVFMMAGNKRIMI